MPVGELGSECGSDHLGEAIRTLGLLDVESGKELVATNNFLDRMHQLIQRAGSGFPQPEITSSSLLEKIRPQPENEQFLLVRAQ